MIENDNRKKRLSINNRAPYLIFASSREYTVTRHVESEIKVREREKLRAKSRKFPRDYRLCGGENLARGSIPMITVDRGIFFAADIVRVSPVADRNL